MGMNKKNVEIFSTITTLQYSWVKTLNDDSFHAWKGILLLVARKHLGIKVCISF